MKALFFLRGIHYDRIFENLFRELLGRGHEIHVVLVHEKSDQRDDKTRLFDEFSEQYAFSYEQLPRRRDPWVAPAVATRYGLDYLRYLEPEYSGADPLRARARERAPAVVRRLLAAPLFRGRGGRRVVGGALRASEAVLPVPRSLKTLIKAHDPDVVLVSPLVGLGSLEGDYLRAAQALRIPTVLVVASWDNLSNKGLIHDVPGADDRLEPDAGRGSGEVARDPARADRRRRCPQLRPLVHLAAEPDSSGIHARTRSRSRATAHPVRRIVAVHQRRRDRLHPRVARARQRSPSAPRVRGSRAPAPAEPPRVGRTGHRGARQDGDLAARRRRAARRAGQARLLRLALPCPSHGGREHERTRRSCCRRASGADVRNGWLSRPGGDAALLVHRSRQRGRPRQRRLQLG